jgi:hypothetical protein
MNAATPPDPDKQQQELQKMLALKRHEAPPPRFFRSFSEQVIDRLHAQEPPAPPTLRQRLGLDIDSKPVLVCASGIAVCGLLVVGLIASLRLGPPQRPPRAPEETFLILTPPPTATASPEQEGGPAGGSAPLPRLGEPVREPSLSPLTSPRTQGAVPVSVQGLAAPPPQK